MILDIEDVKTREVESHTFFVRFYEGMHLYIPIVSYNK